MSAKEKAKELVTKFSGFVLDIDSFGNYDPITEQRMSKDCAKIAVENIMNTFSDIDQRRDYWNEVLTEIDKII